MNMHMIASEICELVKNLSWQTVVSIFNSYSNDIWGRDLLLSLDCYTYPWSYLIMLSWVKKHQVLFFESLVWTWPGIEPQSHRPLDEHYANELISAKCSGTNFPKFRFYFWSIRLFPLAINLTMNIKIKKKEKQNSKFYHILKK